MAITFDDILHDAQPALQHGPSAVVDEATEGRDWLWSFGLSDAIGEVVDVEALGVTGECVVYAERNATSPLITLTVAISGADITITATDTATVDLAGGTSLTRQCPWRFTLTETATGRSADVWGVHDSMLLIRGDN